MDRYFNLEPTPSAYRAAQALPDSGPVRFVSLIRLRRDQADGRADQARRQWDDHLSVIRSAAGGRVLLDAHVVTASSAAPGAWDRLLVSEFPDQAAVRTFLRDERWLDHLDVRRNAVELSPTVMTVPTPFSGSSQASAHDYGPPVTDMAELTVTAPVVGAARCLPAGRSFFWMNALRLRQDRSLGLTRAAYAGWRMVYNTVAAELGVTQILNDSIACTFIGADQRWDFLNLVRYPDLDTLEKMLLDPRIRAASAMRLAAIEDNIVILAIEGDGAGQGLSIPQIG